jgi:tRNA nucleotidyltransferase (CCA-adding enzyme)
VIKKPRHNKKDLTVITTHINADFDALASMLAAQKLYPDALVVFPGSQEKNLRNFFIKSMVYLFNMVNIKDVDLSNLKRLVLVDTKQPSRIGKFAAILDWWIPNSQAVSESLQPYSIGLTSIYTFTIITLP